MSKCVGPVHIKFAKSILFFEDILVVMKVEQYVIFILRLHKFDIFPFHGVEIYFYKRIDYLVAAVHPLFAAMNVVGVVQEESSIMFARLEVSRRCMKWSFTFNSVCFWVKHNNILKINAPFPLWAISFAPKEVVHLLFEKAATESVAPFDLIWIWHVLWKNYVPVYLRWIILIIVV